ncbi:MAG: alpha/beta fold hydrolase [Bacteroidota bacterium]
MGTQEITSEDRFIDIDGIRTHLRIKGTGQPLVLVHGLGGPLMWQKIFDPLARHFQVVILDLPGYGDSNPPQKNFSTDDYAGFLYRCIGELNLKKIHLCGISYGGHISATFAAHHGNIIDSLILIGSTGLMPRPFFLLNNFLLAPSIFFIDHIILRSELIMCRMGARSFYNIGNRPSDLCHQFFIQLSKDGRRKIWLNSLQNIFSDQLKFRKILAALRVRTLIVWGENDMTASHEYAEEFHRLIAGSTIITYGKCGHSVPLEYPEELCTDILNFINCTSNENITS